MSVVSSRRSRGIGGAYALASWNLACSRCRATSGTTRRGRCSGDRTLNVFATFAHHPKLMKRWLVFGNHVLAKSTLPARDRELLDPAHRLELPGAVRVGPARRDRARHRHHRRRDRAHRRRSGRRRLVGADAALLAGGRRAARRADAVGRHLRRARVALRRAATARSRVHGRSVPPGVDGAERVPRAERDDGVTGVPIPTRE